MQVLLCLHHYLDPDQGAPGATLAVGAALTELGCKVEYYGFEHAFPGPQRGGTSCSVQYPWKLSSFLSRHGRDFDVVDVSTGDAWVWASKGRPGAKRPHALITRSHGLEHTVDANARQDARAGIGKLSWKYPLYHGGFRLWEVAKSLQLADMVLMLNRYDRDYAVQNLMVKQEHVRLIGNGISNRFLGLPVPSLEMTSQLKTRIAQVGTYIPRKGIAYAAPALNRILAHHPQVTMTFLGTGCPEAQVHADFDPMVRAQVTVIPHYKRDELPALLQGHQIKLFPTLSEGFGLGLLEAMACGLASVTTNVPGPTEFAINDKNALVVPPRDSAAIEQALERLIADSELLYRLRQEAYSTAQNYGWSRIGRDTLALYEEVLQARLQ